MILCFWSRSISNCSFANCNRLIFICASAKSNCISSSLIVLFGTKPIIIDITKIIQINQQPPSCIQSKCLPIVRACDDEPIVDVCPNWVGNRIRMSSTDDMAPVDVDWIVNAGEFIACCCSASSIGTWALNCDWLVSIVMFELANSTGIVCGGIGLLLAELACSPTCSGMTGFASLMLT